MPGTKSMRWTVPETQPQRPRPYLTEVSPRRAARRRLKWGTPTPVASLAQHNSHPKVVVADSLYCNAAFLTVQVVYALVRIRSNWVLYEEPPEREPGQRGRPRKHGLKFKLSEPNRPPWRTAGGNHCVQKAEEIRGDSITVEPDSRWDDCTCRRGSSPKLPGTDENCLVLIVV